MYKFELWTGWINVNLQVQSQSGYERKTMVLLGK